MKNFAILSAFTVILFNLSSCSMNCIEGNGKIIEESRTVDEFSKIEVSGAYNLELTQGDGPSLRIKGDEDLLPMIETDIENNKLTIHSDKKICDDDVTLFITTKMLDLLDISGAAKVETKNKFTVDTFKLDVTGAAKADLNIDAQHLTTELSGAGMISYMGEADEHIVEISGAAKLEAPQLMVNDYSLDLAGASKCVIHVNDELNIEASGASQISYSGNPTVVNKEISGAANLKKVD